MKKVLAFCMALLMIFSLAACTKPDTNKPNENPPAEVGAKPDNYPTKNISWIVPVKAGSPTDLATRQLADALAERLGVTVAVENVVGGQQTIGINDALSRGSDGYTIFSLANAGLITQPIMNPDIGYKLDDINLVAMITPACMATITVKNDSPIKTYDDFVKFVKENKEFTYAVPNSGGYGHLSILYLLGQIPGASLGKAVAYDGNNGAYQALLTGEVDFAISDDNFIFNYFNDGACNTIACLAGESSYYLPKVPAVGNYGIKNMDALAGWKIVGISSDVPDDIAAYLTKQIDEILETDAYKDYLLKSGCGSFSHIQDSEEITGLVKDAYVLYEKILKEAGLL